MCIIFLTPGQLPRVSTRLELQLQMKSLNQNNPTDQMDEEIVQIYLLLQPLLRTEKRKILVSQEARRIPPELWAEIFLGMSFKIYRCWLHRCGVIGIRLHYQPLPPNSRI